MLQYSFLKEGNEQKKDPCFTEVFSKKLKRCYFFGVGQVFIPKIA